MLHGQRSIKELEPLPVICGNFLTSHSPLSAAPECKTGGRRLESYSDVTFCNEVCQLTRYGYTAVKEAEVSNHLSNYGKILCQVKIFEAMIQHRREALVIPASATIGEGYLLT
jgi:hypothetical protein